tara:strand:- start:2240 stop:3394 length:1155 start_codon:yes stop_codon:yes gene_type:complete
MVTSVIVASSGGDYTTLSAAEGAENTDLTGLGDFTFNCEGFEDTTDVGFSGWTTTASDRIIVKAAVGHEHDGVPYAQSGGGYKINTTTLTPIRFGEDFVTLQDIETNSSSGGAISFAGITSASDIIVNRCILTDTRASASTSYVVFGSVANLNLTLANCLILGKARAIDTRNATSVAIDNCTMFTDAAALGLIADTELTCKNTYVGGYSTEDFWTGGAAPAGNNNASADTTATTDYTTSLISKATADQFTNPTVDTATCDFSLKSGNALEDAGATLTYADDITNTTRAGTWDIGAYETVAGPSSGINTRYRRFSMMNFGKGTLLVDPATSGVDQGERQTFLNAYSGISFSNPAPATDTELLTTLQSMGRGFGQARAARLGGELQ